jgi:hypothetical protein
MACRFAEDWAYLLKGLSASPAPIKQKAITVIRLYRPMVYGPISLPQRAQDYGYDCMALKFKAKEVRVVIGIK